MASSVTEGGDIDPSSTLNIETANKDGVIVIFGHPPFACKRHTVTTTAKLIYSCFGD